MDYTAKSIADKADIALVGGLVPDEVMELIAPYIAREGVPTQVQDVYKVRRGRWTNIKIWSQVDLGTCRRRDLFVTDSKFNEVPMEVIEFNFDDNYGRYDEILAKLNPDVEAPKPKVRLSDLL